LLNSILRGVLHWGDRVAMNDYLHGEPGGWWEIPEDWNYCLTCRDPSSYRIGPDGRLEDRDGAPVQVVHGNGLTLAPWASSFADRGRSRLHGKAEGIHEFGRFDGSALLFVQESDPPTECIHKRAPRIGNLSLCRFAGI
jgi:hypothetical protein